MMRLELGTPVRCSDDKLGELNDVVIDPVTRRVTHLVVSGDGRFQAARLVPIALAETDGGAELCLRCSTDEAGSFKLVQDFAYLRLDELPPQDPEWDVGIEHVLSVPYYPMGDPADFAYSYENQVGISYDRVPKGDVEIRRSSTVVSEDGEFVGNVDGFLLDDDQRITHLVLGRGHLWRRRELTVPIDAVTKVETDSLALKLTKREVRRLPGSRLHRWHIGGTNEHADV